MAKDSKKRKLNQILKRSGIGMKWQRKFPDQKSWSEEVNKIIKK